MGRQGTCVVTSISHCEDAGHNLYITLAQRCLHGSEPITWFTSSSVCVAVRWDVNIEECKNAGVN